jgi:hypothetical protein
MRNERELVDDLIDFARKPEARDLTRGHIEFWCCAYLPPRRGQNGKAQGNALGIRSE